MGTETLLKRLGEITGKENLFTTKAEILPYARGPEFSGVEIPTNLPLAVARPRHLGHLAALVQFCSLEGMPISICGGNTSPAPKKLPADSLVILTTGLNRIHEVNSEDRLAHVEAGVTLAELGRTAAGKGLFYPPDPATSGICTVGGAIAMNTAGPASLKYGAASSYIHALRVMTVKGEFLNCAASLGAPGKIAPGYPLGRLFCGAAGSLGIICQATIRLLPKPQARAACAAAFKTDEDAARTAAEIIGAMITPASMEFLDRECARALNEKWDSPMLLLEFDGNVGDVAEEHAKCLKICQKHGAAITRDTGADGKPVANRGRMAPTLRAAFGDFMLQTACCPVSRLAALLDGVCEIAQNTGAPIAVFGHAGIARMHAAIFLNNRPQAASQAAKDLFTLELVLNRQLESEADASATRKEWEAGHRELLEYSQAIKKVFDPGNLLVSPVEPDNSGLFANIGHL